MHLNVVRNTKYISGSLFIILKVIDSYINDYKSLFFHMAVLLIFGKYFGGGIGKNEKSTTVTGKEMRSLDLVLHHVLNYRYYICY